MFYTTQPGGFYGGGMGNEGAMRPPMMAGNPFGPAFQIPGKRPGGQPVLPGESKEAVEGVYGRPGPQPMPGNAPLGLPMAMGSSNLFNALPGAPGNFGGFNVAAEYPADQWNKDDEILLKSLQRGEMGKGPQIDKAIQDLMRQRGSGPVRGA